MQNTFSSLFKVSLVKIEVRMSQDFSNRLVGLAFNCNGGERIEISSNVLFLCFFA